MSFEYDLDALLGSVAPDLAQVPFDTALERLTRKNLAPARPQTMTRPSTPPRYVVPQPVEADIPDDVPLPRARPKSAPPRDWGQGDELIGDAPEFGKGDDLVDANPRPTAAMPPVQDLDTAKAPVKPMPPVQGLDFNEQPIPPVQGLDLPQPAKPNSFMRGFVSGMVEQNPQMTAETLEGLSHLAPKDFQESLRKGSSDLHSFSKGKMPDEYKRSAGSMWDIKGIDDALTWAGETVGQGVASTVPSMITGVGGALVGGRLAGKPGAVVGGLGGAAVPSAALNYGEVYKALKDEKVDPKEAADYALIATGPMMLLDTLSIGPIVTRLGGIQIVKQEIARSIAKRIAAEAAKGVGREAITEMAQEMVKDATVSIAADKPFWTVEHAKGWAESGVAGGLTGGLMGGAGGIRQDQVRAPAAAAAPGAATPGTGPGIDPNAPSSPEDIAEFMRQAEATRPAPPPPGAEAPKADPLDPIREFMGAKGLSPDQVEAMIRGMSEADLAKTLAEVEAQKAKEQPQAGPEQPTAEAPQPQPAQPATATDEERGTLRAYGYEDAQIDAMSPRQRAAEMADARDAGVVPEPVAPKAAQPAQEPVSPEMREVVPAAAQPEPQAAETPKPIRNLPETIAETADFGTGDIEVGTRSAVVPVETAQDLQAATQRAAIPYSPAQGEANNRPLGHARWNGLDLSIETPAGGVRKGVDKKTGQPWETTMGAAYGYFKGVQGADNMHLDAFIGEQPESQTVYVINENDRATGKYRQSKAMIGFPSREAAIAAYTGTSSKSAADIGGVAAVDVAEFKDWLKTGNTRKAFPLPKAPRAPAPRRVNTEPTSLLQMIAFKGGLKPTPELRAMGITSKDRIRVPGVGWRSIMRGKGQTLDEVAESMVEEGFLPPESDLRPGDTGLHNQIRDMIDEERRGRPSVRLSDQGVQTKSEAAQIEDENAHRDAVLADNRAEIEALVAEYDLPATEQEIRRAAEIMADEGMAADDALERASMLVVDEEMVDGHDEIADTYGYGAFDNEVLPDSAYEDGAEAAGRFDDAEGAERAEAEAVGEPVSRAGEDVERQGEDAEGGRADVEAPGRGGTDQREAAEADGRATDAQDAADAETAQEVGAEQGVTGFTTAKGSTYVVHEDGTTTRNKAARPDAGHEGDSGSKPRTAKTIYVDANQASGLSGAGLSNDTGKGYRVVLRGNKATMVWWNEKQGKWGTSELSRDIPFTTAPEIGKAPVELWRPKNDVPGRVAYSGQHAGNAITEVHRQPRAATEKGVDNKPQLVLSGAEKARDADLAQRKADAPLKPKKAQEQMDVGMFGDDSKQTDLMDMVSQPRVASAGTRGARPTAKPVEAPTPAATPDQKRIEDFGEKIEGARKDTFAGFKEALGDKIDVLAEPLSKSFPQPNYEKLAASGVSKRVLAHIAIMRDMIPNRPRVPYKAKRWAAEVETLRSFARKLLDGEIDVAAFEKAARTNHLLNMLPLTAEAIEDVAPADMSRAAQYRVNSSSFSMLNGKRYTPSKTFWFMESPKSRSVRNPFSNDPADQYTYRDNPEEAVALAKRIIASELEGKPADTSERSKYTDVGLYRDRTTKQIFLGFKVRSTVIRLKAGFADSKAAREYREERRDELQATIDAMRKGPNMRGTENRARSGEALREGDVTPELFGSTFGFRGVQFGNYVEGPRRQADLNRAFDALMDLADAVGVPPRALSLNGQLGLAFGARGKGGKDAAAAHYEPGGVVINLTKGSGPGSLGHEWLHALDNYFARQDKAGGYMSDRRRDTGPVREEIYKAWKDIEATLQNGSFAERSAEFDQARSKPYWGTTIEKAARAFERYVVDRLAEKGAVNDYLANIDMSGGAYPTAEEMQNLGIRQAFDKLFDTIETRETDKGVELYSLRGEPAARRFGIPRDAARPIATFQSDQPLKRHPDYVAAKAGNPEAAARLVESLVRDEDIEAAKGFGADVTYVPVIAREQSGDNKIPDLLAALYAERTGAHSTSDIVQANQALHTGAGAMERIANRARFDGTVERGQRYVLVDDVSVMGSTLADLADHIQRNGGEVAGVVLLANASRTGVLTPSLAVIRDIERRFGDAVQGLFHIEPAGLTADEAAYLRNFKDADALRARRDASEVERGARLRSKDVRPEGLEPDESFSLATGPQLRLSDSPAAVTRRTELEQQLTAIIQRMVGDRVSIRFEDTIPIDGVEGWGSYGQDRQTAAGSYAPARALIQLALADPKYAGQERSTAYHEAFHAVEHLIWNEEGPDRAILARENARLEEWILKNMNFSDGMTREQISELAGFEVRAIAFEGYVARRERGEQVGGIHIAIRRGFERLFQLLRRIRNYLEGLGYRTSEDVFSDVYEGKTRARADSAERSMAGAAEGLNTEGAFERWFGDSKVVDADGQPLVVYHGTNSSFDAFSKEKLGSATGARSAKMGFFFTDEADLASSYADNESVYDRGALGKIDKLTGGRYRNFNEAILRATGLRSALPSGQNVMPVYLSIKNPLEVDFDGESASNERPYSAVIAQARAAGHDGVIIRGTIDPGFSEYPGPRGGMYHPADLFIAFEPNQIKSATANRGTFDPNDDRIQYNVRTARPRSGNIPTPGFQVPTESVREALADDSMPMRQRLSTAIDALMLTPSRAIWDRLIDLSRFQRAAEMASGEATAQNLDTHLAASIYPGRVGERLKDIEKLLRPIIKALKAHDVSRDELHEYLYARHAAERNAQIRTIDPNNDAGSGMTDQEAQDILNRASPRQADFDAVAALVDNMVRFNRDLMEAEGLESTETLMQWGGAYQHYVPLKGAENEESDQINPSTGKGFTTRGPESRRALGRFGRADDILTNLLEQTQRTIIRSEKNRVAKTFLRWVQRNPTPLIEHGLAETRREVNKTTGLVETIWVTTPKDARNAFAAKVAGETHYLRIEHDGLLLALKSLDMDRLNPFFAAMARFTRQFAAFQTARNPEFVFSNLSRDLQDAGFALNAETRKGFQKAFWKHILNGKALMSAVLGQIDKTDNRYGRLYEEWRLAGGKISTFGYKDLETIRRELEDELARSTESMTRKVLAQPSRLVNPFTGHIVKTFEAISDIAESMTRLAVYSAARDVGMSQALAAKAARSMTVDFQAKGKYGPYISAGYAFASPAIQGSVNLIRRLRRSKRMRYAAAGVATFGFALTLWNLAAGDDEDDEGKKINRYADLKYHERSKNIMIFWPGKKEPTQLSLGGKLPLGYALAPFFMMGENAAMSIMGKKKPLEAFTDWLGTAAKTFNPLGGEGSIFAWHFWLGAMSPTFFDPVVELGRNRNWLNRPIHPDEMPWTKGKPNSEQSKMLTNPLAISAAETFNRWTGGNHFQKGAVDLYPDDLEYAWNFALGGYGKFMANNYGMTADKFAGVETPVERIPFVRRFIVPGQSQSREAEKYYDAANESTERSRAVRDATKALQAGVYTEDAQKTIEELGPKIGARTGKRGGLAIETEKTFKDANKELSALRQQERQARANSNLERAERADIIKEIRDRQNAIMKQTIRSYRNIESPAP